MTAGYPTDATENAVQATLAAAGYSDNTTLFPTSESVISLRAHANGKYVDAPANGAGSLIADATSVGTEPDFDLFASPGGAISLRAHANGQFVTAESAGRGAADRQPGLGRSVGDVRPDQQPRRSGELPRAGQRPIVTARTPAPPP